MTGLARLPRLTADHSVGAPISRDDLWWLIAQVYQLRSELAAAEIMAGSLADDTTQCIPPGTEGLRECTYKPGHHSPHSFEVGAMDIRPAAKGQRRCETRKGGARRCGREYGHTGPCLLQT